MYQKGFIQPIISGNLLNQPVKSHIPTGSEVLIRWLERRVAVSAQAFCKWQLQRFPPSELQKICQARR